MTCDIVLGGQWGDEGKAKMIDVLAADYDIIVRYQGGANAGHTVCHNNQKYVFHLIPSGILYPQKICVLGNGVVIDLKALNDEIEQLSKQGIDFSGRLKISEQAFLVLPLHLFLDKAREEKNTQKIGTTHRGIGPAYLDKYQRIGIRLVDLSDRNILLNKLSENIREKQILFDHYYSGNYQIDIEQMATDILSEYEKLKPYITNTPYFLNGAIKEHKKILLEGAQGTGLDIDFGSYPFVTTSSPSSGGAILGTGIGISKIKSIIGVFKCYITRVGGGNLPTALPEIEMSQMQKRGKEFGATTGRERSCGWFDGVQAKYAAMVNGLTDIALTKIDILDDYQEIKLCTHYKINGEKTDVFPSDLKTFNKIKPLYKTFSGWQSSTKGITAYQDLPQKAREYIEFLAEYLACPISFISTGAERKDIIKKQTKQI